MFRILISSIAAIIIFACLTGLFLSIFTVFLSDLDQDSAFVILSSFFGAFFAFLSIRVAQYLDSLRVREREHYNALVFYDLNLNKAISWAADNRYLIDGLVELINEKKEGQIIVWKSYLKQFDFDDSNVIRLLNTDFANEVINRSVDIRKLNGSSESLNMWRDELTQLLFSGHEASDFAKNHLDRVYNDFLEIGEAFDRFLINAQHTIAACRVLAKKRTLLSYLFPLIHRKHYSSDFESLRKIELEILEKEIATGAARKFDKVRHPKDPTAK